MVHRWDVGVTNGRIRFGSVTGVPHKRQMIRAAHHANVDDAAVGSVLRAVRIRLGLSQSDVAVAAGTSQAMVSLVERGGLEATSVKLVRRVASVLGVSLPFTPRWRGPELAKLLDERHARIVEAVVGRLRELGWDVRAEHTFSVYGERGSIDVFAWLPEAGALLVVEVKSRIVDVQDLLSSVDRKERLSFDLARGIGWTPVLRATLLVLPAEHQARSAVARHPALFDAAFPSRGREVGTWLRRPSGGLRGIWFVPISAPGDTRHRGNGQLRVGGPSRTRRGAPGPGNGPG
jgi:transcriptional regulator with XRE-family HTH domain